MSNNTRENTIDTTQWEAFCDAIKTEGAQLLASGQVMDDLTQAEGLRYLSRLVRAGLERYIEFSNPVNPLFFKLCHETIKIGGDNPDNLYLSCRVSSDHSYQITGNRGTVNYISLSLADDQLATNGKQITTGFLDDQSITPDHNGDFVIQLGGEPTEGTWLPLTPETNTVFVRQTFLDRSREREATFSITRSSTLPQDEKLTLAEVNEGLKKAQSFVSTTGNLFVDWAESYYPHQNTLPPADQAYIASIGGDPNIYYYLSAFRLSRGEALLVHLPEVPPCEMWNFQLCNHWLESLDYTNHTIHLNRSTATPNDDGSITLVVSDESPGVPNHLETCGHSMGTMVFRWTRAERIVHPQCQVVKLKGLDWRPYLKRWT